jgi:diguanylate cyclase (GGDEF)-like protein
VSGQVKAGTNIIIISAEGPHPEVVRDLANRVGEDLRLYGQGLYETFVINSLDPATRPGSPIQPNKPLNIALAGIFGLILGVGLAFLSNYLQMPLASNVSVSVLDAETGVYNKEYMIRRLSEEMGRAKRNRYPLSLALMQIDELAMIRGANASKVKQEILRQVAVLTNQYLREEDIVARFSKDTFACLLPDTSGENAKAIMEYLQTRIAWTPFESQASGTKFNLKGVVGITAYNHNGTSREELIDKASQALKMAQISGESKSYLALDDILEDAAAHRHDEVARI